MPRRLGVRPRTLAGRLLLWHAVAMLAVLLACGVILDRFLERSFVQQLTSALVSDARGLRQSLPVTGNLEPEVRRIGSAMGVRITVIRTDGVVLADSEHDPETMQNHRERPEIQQALTGHVGESSRQSHTIGIRFRYVALPPVADRIVRVALPLTDVDARLRSVRAVLGIGFGLAALAGLLALGLIARGASRPLRRIIDAVERVGAGEPDVEVPERGTRELLLLASTVNRMRSEIESRIDSIERERTTRDAILSSLEEGVVLFDAAGSAVYRNERAVRLLGEEPAEAKALPPSVLGAAVRQAEGRPRSVDAEAGPSGRTVLATAVALGDGRVLLVLRDVTEAKTLEATRRDFVANASHELKTPAASIRALAETITTAAADDPEALHRFAGQLELEALRLSTIIGDLLDLSRLEGGMTDRAPVRLDVLAAEETARARPSAARREVELILRAEHPVAVTGSRGDLALLVRNLVENALHYTKAGGHVGVTVSAEDGTAVLRVTDTGIGIPARDQRRIFERFYRVDRARSRETGGTGLGLSIVKHVAENHGGSVQVGSRLGEGSTFTARLPLNRGVTVDPRATASLSSAE